jgi:hypothetical protein
MPSYNTWTEQLYGYTEYLYWVPQSINKKTPAGQGGMEEFRKTSVKIRSQEVPLNILFNILMRLLPWRIKNRILNCFMVSAVENFGQQLHKVDPIVKTRKLKFKVR